MCVYQQQQQQKMFYFHCEWRTYIVWLLFSFINIYACTKTKRFYSQNCEFTPNEEQRQTDKKWIVVYDIDKKNFM